MANTLKERRDDVVFYVYNTISVLRHCLKKEDNPEWKRLEEKLEALLVDDYDRLCLLNKDDLYPSIPPKGQQ